jgi:phage protein D
MLLVPAPSYEIAVNDSPLEAGVTQFVRSIEYESADGIPDEVRIELANPGAVLTQRRIFSIGSEVSLWMGDGNDLVFMARARIERVAPRFASTGATLSVTALTRDFIMSRNSPPPKKSSKKNQNKGGRLFHGMSITDAVRQRARAYAFALDVDDGPPTTWGQIQPANMTDFDFVQSMANQLGWIWWVDGDEKGRWVFHFRDPDRLRVQTRKVQLTWGDPNSSIEYDGQMAFEDMKTDIIMSAKNPETGRMMYVEVTADEVGSTIDDGIYAGFVEQEAAAIKQPTSVALALGDSRVQVVADRAFKTEAEMKAWATVWFKRNALRFITAHITTPGIGLSDLRALHIHDIDGMGEPWDGAYYFTRVRHVIGAGSAYTIDADVRRVFG